ncbi:MAG: endonuclease V [Lachnospiraceae bacterium]|nr:endonuclease V [Lachnospiraceae bacterium]
MERKLEESLEQEYIRIQNTLQSKIRIPGKGRERNFPGEELSMAREDSEEETYIELSSIQTVAGVDLAYWKLEETEYAVCCIVVLEYLSHKVLEEKEYMDVVKVPYVPGCLAFRELPLFLGANRMLEHEPDVYFFDGNGYLHPRHMGLATHAGILLEKPTIGIAKSYYKIGDVNYLMPEDEQFAHTDIVIEGEVYGRVLRTQKGVKPLFLSVGNCIDLDMAMTLTKTMVTKDSHIPIPTRFADIMTHESRKRYKNRQGGTSI